eukprot:Unigene14338_Nuclearia_a/m.43260 Unigene14338_Nuclearia_a/g.43260  ORF Unigene14338_Nuclearia_a/g.43260 Unigene14338_Nuclearia_a/m.43260 type:complete len:324 (+) Unigene14338_Nuclearia_a:312-1283(+)
MASSRGPRDAGSAESDACDDELDDGADDDNSIDASAGSSSSSRWASAATAAASRPPSWVATRCACSRMPSLTRRSALTPSTSTPSTAPPVATSAATTAHDRCPCAAGTTAGPKMACIAAASMTSSWCGRAGSACKIGRKSMNVSSPVSRHSATPTGSAATSVAPLSTIAPLLCRCVQRYSSRYVQSRSSPPSIGATASRAASNAPSTASDDGCRRASASRAISSARACWRRVASTASVASCIVTTTPTTRLSSRISARTGAADHAKKTSHVLSSSSRGPSRTSTRCSWTVSVAAPVAKTRSIGPRLTTRSLSTSGQSSRAARP